MARFWQIAGGPSGRSYSTVFLRHGVGLIGPGDPGAWNPGRPDEDFDNSSSVRRFATEPQEGDVVLLRAGNSVVRAVGLIASNYQYLPQFDDVNGWDLQHARRIRWSRLPQDHDFGQALFGANPRRFGEVNRAEVVDFARRFVNSPPTDWQTATLPSLRFTTAGIVVIILGLAIGAPIGAVSARQLLPLLTLSKTLRRSGAGAGTRAPGGIPAAPRGRADRDLQTA